MKELFFHLLSRKSKYIVVVTALVILAAQFTAECSVLSVQAGQSPKIFADPNLIPNTTGIGFNTSHVAPNNNVITGGNAGIVAGSIGMNGGRIYVDPPNPKTPTPVLSVIATNNQPIPPSAPIQNQPDLAQLLSQVNAMQAIVVPQHDQGRIFEKDRVIHNIHINGEVIVGSYQYSPSFNSYSVVNTDNVVRATSLKVENGVVLLK